MLKQLVANGPNIEGSAYQLPDLVSHANICMPIANHSEVSTGQHCEFTSKKLKFTKCDISMFELFSFNNLRTAAPLLQ